MTARRCIGYGQFDTCGALLGPKDLALNPVGLWCVRCEGLRRETISGQMESISVGFERLAREAEDGEGADVDGA